MNKQGSFLDLMLSSLWLSDFVIDVLVGVLVAVISGVIIRLYKEKRRTKNESEFRRWVNFIWAKDWSINTISSRNKE